MSNKKYNILLVHNFYQKPGGEDTVFYNEKKLLEKNGHKVIIYTRDNKELKKYNILKKILLPITIIFNLKTYFDIKRTIKENDIDIVHVHNTLSLISPSVFYAAVKMNKPVVQTLHNFRMQCPNAFFYRDGHICEDCVNDGLLCALKHKCYRSSFFQTLAIVLMLIIHRFIGIYKKVNFICLTEFNKNKLLLINNIKQVVDEEKVFIKPNFVFESELNIKLNNEITNDDYRQKSKEYYLFVGRLDEIKGIDVALEAFSKMSDRDLHVVGSGGDEYIKKYSNFSNIKFLGQLSHSEVLFKMLNAHALIFSSKWYEGLPMTIIESYENYLPIISCNTGNISELVIDEITGLHFETCNVNSLINSIDKFNEMNIDCFRLNSRKEYSKKYSHIIGYNNIEIVYRNLFDARIKEV